MNKPYVTMGRAFRVLATFPDTEDGMRQANAHMEANPGLGVIVVEDGLIKLADKADKGVRLDPLECSCCGGDAGRFVQWHNRDTGYGICPRCVTWLLDERKTDPEEFSRCYGLAGIHFANPTPSV